MRPLRMLCWSLFLSMMLVSCAQFDPLPFEQHAHGDEGKGGVHTTVSESKRLVMFHSPLCGCCLEWVSHASMHGFQVKNVHSLNMSGIKTTFNVPSSARSCHTTVHQASDREFVFEGHIPAYLIERFLASPPRNAVGLAVPGMPIGSPGMERGRQYEDYSVLLLLKDGSTQVYERVHKPQ
ncbi:MAG: DUF411 domain-containing protein [Pseudomonadota bacterium]